MVPKLDELTKVTLFIEGLFDTEIQKEVRRDHPKSLSEATRVARTASLNAEGSKKVLEKQPRVLQLGDQGQDNCLTLNDSSCFAEDFVSNAGSRDTLPPIVRRQFRLRPQREPPVIKGARSLVEAEVLHKPDFRNSHLVVHVAMVGSDIKARALIDSGAAHNFVSES